MRFRGMGGSSRRVYSPNHRFRGSGIGWLIVGGLVGVLHSDVASGGSRVGLSSTWDCPGGVETGNVDLVVMDDDDVDDDDDDTIG
jgi:hypothetical protein